MHLSIILLSIFGPVIVTSSRMIRYVFDADPQCNAEDQLKIDHIFNPEDRRRLRTSSRPDRDLRTRCKDNCAGYVPGMCHSVGCKGDKDRFLGHTIERDLQQIPKTCVEQMEEIDDKLDELISTSAVSELCKGTIKRENRNSTCYDDVVYGVIEGITVWDMTTPTHPIIIEDDMPTAGFTICKSQLFNIEARVNPCVDFVHFHMVHAGNASIYERDNFEQDVPYTFFGRDDALHMNARRLPRGRYNFTIMPDGIESKKQHINFRVIRC